MCSLEDLKVGEVGVSFPPFIWEGKVEVVQQILVFYMCAAFSQKIVEFLSGPIFFNFGKHVGILTFIPPLFHSLFIHNWNGVKASCR